MSEYIVETGASPGYAGANNAAVATAGFVNLATAAESSNGGDSTDTLATAAGMIEMATSGVSIGHVDGVNALASTADGFHLADAGKPLSHTAGINVPTLAADSLVLAALGINTLHITATSGANGKTTDLDPSKVPPLAAEILFRIFELAMIADGKTVYPLLTQNIAKPDVVLSCLRVK